MSTTNSFVLDLGVMDWDLFQEQRLILMGIVVNYQSTVLTEEQLEALAGILNLTDHIVDTAKDEGIEMPKITEEGLVYPCPHVWSAWRDYDEHVFDGTYRYWRECTIAGCKARQKTEDLTPTGELQNYERD